MESISKLCEDFLDFEAVETHSKII